MISRAVPPHGARLSGWLKGTASGPVDQTLLVSAEVLECV